MESWLGGQRSQELFQDVRTYLMFIGQPRSGTSLLGSLLNAHPNMCVAQELNALRYVNRGYDRRQLFWLLLKRDETFAKSGRMWTGYSYAVPTQWQGRFAELQVIGDKKAGLSTDQFGKKPQLFETLSRKVGVPVRIIHVVRDPFNVITTMHRRKRISLEESADIYFRRCETNWQLMQQHGPAIKTLHLEDLIVSPEQQFEELCGFLGVDAPQDYIDDCAALLFSKPRQSKTDCDWPSSLAGAVSRRAEQFPFLNGYQYGKDHDASRKLAA
jgi:hypothetical protein